MSSFGTATAYQIGFTVEIEAPDAGCDEDDTSIILEAVKASFPDFGNNYLHNNRFSGEIELTKWSETGDVRFRSLTEEEEEYPQEEDEREDEEEQAHRELGLFNYNGFCACAFCPPDNGDGRRLGGGKKFMMNKMFERVNQRTKIRVKQVVQFNTSDDCQRTKNDWVVTFTRTQS